VFGIAVVAGSLAGLPWGVTGVAVGAVAALFSNFLLMTQLSLRLTGLRLSEFAAAHLPGLALSAVIGVSVWFLADRLRALEVSPLVLLIERLAPNLGPQPPAQLAAALEELIRDLAEQVGKGGRLRILE
jgi:hypothetical protein